MPPNPDPEIICFQHCCQDSRIFCLEVPDDCPVCGNRLVEEGAQDDSGDIKKNEVSFLTHPFQMPCPFVCAQDSPCSILIRTTSGDFLHTYQSTDNPASASAASSSDLHIGITDSKGVVYDFDCEGVHRNSFNNETDEEGKSNQKRKYYNSPWNQCLVIPIINRSSNKEKDGYSNNEEEEDGMMGVKFMTHWDYILSITSGMDTWSRDNYQKDGNNCYSFVLFFLQMLRVKEIPRESLSSKTSFCQEFILPRTRLASKYIALYRQVIREGVSTYQSTKD